MQKKVLKSFSHWDALVLYFSTKQLCIRVSNDSNFFLPYHQSSVDFFTAFSTLFTSILTLSNFLAFFRAGGLFCLWPCYIRRDGMWSGKWGVNPGLTHIRSQIVRLSSSDQSPLPAASSKQMQLSVIAFYRLRTFLSFLNLYNNKKHWYRNEK